MQFIGHVDSASGNYIFRFGNCGDAREINLIARTYYHQALLLSPETIGGWLEVNNGIFRVISKIDITRHVQHLVGYYGFFPLKLSIYEKLKSHEIMEKSISSDDLQPILGSQTEALYVFDLSKHQEEAVGALILRDMLRYLLYVTRKNPAIRKVGAWGYSKAGREIASRLGMECIKDYEDYEGTSFYEISNPVEKLSASSAPPLVRAMLKAPFRETYTVRCTADLKP